MLGRAWDERYNSSVAGLKRAPLYCCTRESVGLLCTLQLEAVAGREREAVKNVFV